MSKFNLEDVAVSTLHTNLLLLQNNVTNDKLKESKDEISIGDFWTAELAKPTFLSGIDSVITAMETFQKNVSDSFNICNNVLDWQQLKEEYDNYAYLAQVAYNNRYKTESRYNEEKGIYEQVTVLDNAQMVRYTDMLNRKNKKYSDMLEIEKKIETQMSNF